MLSVIRTARTLREAVLAVYRLVAAWLKRHLGRLSAIRAGHRIHLPRPAATAALSAGGFAGRATIGTAIRFVLKTLAREELLLSAGEDEFRAAIGAGQSFVGIQSEPPRFKDRFWLRS